MQNVMPMSASSASEIRELVGKALMKFTDEELSGTDELPAVMINAASVMPRRVSRNKVVFICYRGGKMIGSALKVVG